MGLTVLKIWFIPKHRVVIVSMSVLQQRLCVQTRISRGLGPQGCLSSGFLWLLLTLTSSKLGGGPWGAPNLAGSKNLAVSTEIAPCLRGLGEGHIMESRGCQSKVPLAEVGT